MAEVIIPTITEVGFFILQVIFAMILWQGYQLIKAKVENEKIKTERARVALKLSSPKESEDLKDIQKPDTLTEKIQHKLITQLNKPKKEEAVIDFNG